MLKVKNQKSKIVKMSSTASALGKNKEGKEKDSEKKNNRSRITNQVDAAEERDRPD